jgi:hypothetical protein
MSTSPTARRLQEWAAALDTVIAGMDALVCPAADCDGCAACRLAELRPLLNLTSTAARAEIARLLAPPVFPAQPAAEVSQEDRTVCRERLVARQRDVGLDSLRALVVCLAIAERQADQLIIYTPSGAIAPKSPSDPRLSPPTDFLDLHPLLGAIQFTAEGYREHLYNELPWDEVDKVNRILGNAEADEDDDDDEEDRDGDPSDDGPDGPDGAALPLVALAAE